MNRRSAVLALMSAVVTACSSNEAKQSAPSSTAPDDAPTPTTDAPPTTTTPTTIVPGSNAYLSRERLNDYVGSYAGRWKGAWADGVTGLTGTIGLTAKIDPDARTFTVHLTLGPGLLPAPVIAPFSVPVHADEFTVDGETGKFHIERHTPLGRTVIKSDRGMGTGTFLLHIDDIPHPVGIVAIEASGVALRPSEIPVDFTVRFAGGLSSSGHITFTRA